MVSQWAGRQGTATDGRGDVERTEVALKTQSHDGAAGLGGHSLRQGLPAPTEFKPAQAGSERGLARHSRRSPRSQPLKRTAVQRTAGSEDQPPQGTAAQKTSCSGSSMIALRVCTQRAGKEERRGGGGETVRMARGSAWQGGGWVAGPEPSSTAQGSGRPTAVAELQNQQTRTETRK